MFIRRLLILKKNIIIEKVNFIVVEKNKIEKCLIKNEREKLIFNSIF